MEANEYIASLPGQMRSKLLKQPHCCIAIFKCLSAAERHALLRLLAGNVPINFIIPRTAADSEPGSILPSLTKLKLVEKRGYLMHLDDEFRQNLMTALASSPTAFEGEAVPPARMNELIEYTKAKWESLIRPLLARVFPEQFSQSSSRSKKKADDGGISRIIEILTAARLLENNDITKQGYLFLLSEIPKQIWQLVQCYLSTQVHEKQRTSAVSFLIFLGTLTPGNPYDASLLTESDTKLLRDWALFGLVELLEGDNYTVTPLTWQITSSQSSSGAAEIGRWTRGVIVESNFMIYSYTDSPVVIGLLNLFAEVTSRLPNLCVAKLTRRSVREAFRRGLSAENIISYLRQNKHSVHTPKSFGNIDQEALILAGGFDDAEGPERDEEVRVGGIPESVEEQVFLWQEERTRFKAKPGLLYEDFPNLDLFTKVKQYAEDMGVLLWSSEERMSIFIAEMAHERIKQYVKSLNP